MASKKKIDVNMFKKVLSEIGFIDTSNVFKIKVGATKYQITVDFNKEKIDYGSDIAVGSSEVCNFVQPENIVMLECVVRLLRQGYLAKYIELEPLWPRGSGYAKGDILVNDIHHKSFLLIECKTFGREFDVHWNKTLDDGDQLFDYYQQDTNAKYLVMYASQINPSSGTIEFKYRLISVQDNDTYLKMYFPTTEKGYKGARNKSEAFTVWKNVYKQEFNETGLFENNLPYDIGKTAFTTSNLKEITSSIMYDTDKIFKNTLRQHNVGSHENAFDKLVNLFLAKIVDEKQNPDKLQFNWRGVTKDDVKMLTDRLQKLYKQGMKTFLNEDVTYVEKQDIDNIFRYFNDPTDAVKVTVESYFDELKYYTNNDFAFIDVHNEKLFKQNAEILLKVVCMLQNLKLTTANHNQFLGDLFEGFLDNGVKQSEGQYFTPLPIVRFMVSSLPLKSMIAKHSEPLKMIDYACGAGHFLNEYATQIGNFITDVTKRKEFYKNTWGIEKEYRLSKVSKVSAFMYSQDEINVICDDALKYSGRVKNNFFNVLIANPPYSVKGFLETLDENDRNRYELYEEFDKKKMGTNKRIELFFVERAKQLLYSDAVAAIILPAAFLDNPGVHVKAREILLENFDIVALAEFAGGTFGKTPIPTIVLFLRRKKSRPDVSDFVSGRIKAWYAKDFSNDARFKDASILCDFCKLKSINHNDFLRDPSKYLNLQNELYFYYLSKTQPNDVLIIKSPVKNKELKNFLGYEWEARNKSYKISYLGAPKNDFDEDDDSIISSEEGIDRIQTPLFNPKKLYDDDTKINCLIRDNFNGKSIIIPDHLSEIVSLVPLYDLLRFKGKNGENVSISTTPPFKMKSKFKLTMLGKVASIDNKIKQIQATELEDLIVSGADEVKLLPSSRDYDWWSTKSKSKPFLAKGNVVTVGQARYANVKYCNGEFVSSNNMIISSSDEKTTRIKFLYHLFCVYAKHFYKRTGMYPAFNRDLFNNFELPIVPLPVQDKIIDECDKLEKKLNNCTNKIYQLEDKIATIILRTNDRSCKIDFKNDIVANIGRRVTENELDVKGTLPVISANLSNIFGWINKKSIIDSFDTDFVLWSLDGDWMTRYMPPNSPFYPTDHCGYLYVRKGSKINTKYLVYVVGEAGAKEKFSRSKRPSLDKIAALDLRVPKIEIQNKAVNSIVPIEEEIKKLEEEIKKLINQKNVIFDKYLL